MTEPIRPGWKYLIEGENLAGNSVVVVAKLGITGKLAIITVYLGKENGR